MKHELKRIRAEAVPAALERAKHYRLLNDPQQAESICLDILEVAPGHADARIVLLLALTDQFDSRMRDAFPRSRELAAGLDRHRSVEPGRSPRLERLVHRRIAAARRRRPLALRAAPDRHGRRRDPRRPDHHGRSPSPSHRRTVRTPL